MSGVEETAGRSTSYKGLDITANEIISLHPELLDIISTKETRELAVLLGHFQDDLGYMTTQEQREWADACTKWPKVPIHADYLVEQLHEGERTDGRSGHYILVRACMAAIFEDKVSKELRGKVTSLWYTQIHLAENVNSKDPIYAQVVKDLISTWKGTLPQLLAAADDAASRQVNSRTPNLPKGPTRATERNPRER